MTSAAIKKILIPTDFSSNSLHALTFAANFSRLDSQVCFQLLHVHNHLTLVAAASGPAATPVAATCAKPSNAELFKRLEEISIDSAIPTDRIAPVVVKGHPPAAIRDYCQAADVDLVVMTTHGASGVERLLFGSVAEQVVREAPCPVVTINPGAINQDTRGTNDSA